MAITKSQFAAIVAATATEGKTRGLIWIDDGNDNQGQLIRALIEDIAASTSSLTGVKDAMKSETFKFLLSGVGESDGVSMDGNFSTQFIVALKNTASLNLMPDDALINMHVEGVNAIVGLGSEMRGMERDKIRALLKNPALTLDHIKAIGATANRNSAEASDPQTAIAGLDHEDLAALLTNNNALELIFADSKCKSILLDKISSAPGLTASVPSASASIAPSEPTAGDSPALSAPQTQTTTQAIISNVIRISANRNAYTTEEISALMKADMKSQKRGFLVTVDGKETGIMLNGDSRKLSDASEDPNPFALALDTPYAAVVQLPATGSQTLSEIDAAVTSLASNIKAVQESQLLQSGGKPVQFMIPYKKPGQWHWVTYVITAQLGDDGKLKVEDRIHDSLQKGTYIDTTFGDKVKEVFLSAKIATSVAFSSRVSESTLTPQGPNVACGAYVVEAMRSLATQSQDRVWSAFAGEGEALLTEAKMRAKHATLIAEQLPQEQLANFATVVTEISEVDRTRIAAEYHLREIETVKVSDEYKRATDLFNSMEVGQLNAFYALISSEDASEVTSGYRSFVAGVSGVNTNIAAVLLKNERELVFPVGNSLDALKALLQSKIEEKSKGSLLRDGAAAQSPPIPAQAARTSVLQASPLPTPPPATPKAEEIFAEAEALSGDALNATKISSQASRKAVFNALSSGKPVDPTHPEAAADTSSALVATISQAIKKNTKTDTEKAAAYKELANNFSYLKDDRGSADQEGELKAIIESIAKLDPELQRVAQGYMQQNITAETARRAQAEAAQKSQAALPTAAAPTAAAPASTAVVDDSVKKKKQSAFTAKSALIGGGRVGAAAVMAFMMPGVGLIVAMAFLAATKDLGKDQVTMTPEEQEAKEVEIRAAGVNAVKGLMEGSKGVAAASQAKGVATAAPKVPAPAQAPAPAPAQNATASTHPTVQVVASPQASDQLAAPQTADVVVVQNPAAHPNPTPVAANVTDVTGLGLGSVVDQSSSQGHGLLTFAGVAASNLAIQGMEAMQEASSALASVSDALVSHSHSTDQNPNTVLHSQTADVAAPSVDHAAGITVVAAADIVNLDAVVGDLRASGVLLQDSLNLASAPITPEQGRGQGQGQGQ